MKRNQENPTWSINSPYIFEKFAMELQEFSKTGEVPQHGNQDIKYCMELQKQRLEDRGLDMEYTFTPRGAFAKGPGYTKGWEDARYQSSMDYRTCKKEKKFYRDGKKVHTIKKEELFYQTVTDIKGGVSLGHELYTCPSCGAISSLEKFLDGCPNCNLHFQMSDIYPRVTNYYFVEDCADTSKEMKLSIQKTMMISMIICVILMFIRHAIAGFENGMVIAFITSVFGGGLIGAVVGYFVWAATKLFKLAEQAGQSVNMVYRTASSEKSYVARMQQFTPEFSYEYFKDKAVSLLKMIVFSRDASQLPYYVGQPTGNTFYNIVDMEYTGAVGLKTFSESNGFVQVTVDVFIDVTRDFGTQLTTSRRVFTMCLTKNVSKPVDMYFSIKQIRCKNCGAGFDALKTINCPYCSTRYNVGDDDWLVTSVIMM
ncbi:MAG: hypothetical protein IJB96_03355 [Lachnospira sp.]|nr:hypothetical protein [Lachnospira sp.]